MHLLRIFWECAVQILKLYLLLMGIGDIYFTWWFPVSGGYCGVWFCCSCWHWFCGTWFHWKGETWCDMVGQLAYVAYIHMPDFIGLWMILDMHTLIRMLVFPLWFFKVFKICLVLKTLYHLKTYSYIFDL